MTISPDSSYCTDATAALQARGYGNRVALSGPGGMSADPTSEQIKSIPMATAATTVPTVQRKLKGKGTGGI